MSYIDGEKLILTQIQQVTGFNATNAVRGDKWSVLNSGNDDHYVVLRKGEHTRAWQTLRQNLSTYRTIIEVLQRINDTQVANYDAVLEYADAITARLDPYFKLADTANEIQDANLTGGGEAQGIWTNTGDRPSWLMVSLFLDWSEVSNVTFAE